MDMEREKIREYNANLVSATGPPRLSVRATVRAVNLFMETVPRPLLPMTSAWPGRSLHLRGHPSVKQR